ncbi:type II secretion system F family protein [Crenobacter sp. SG2303]|uniref:Type II secretion system F family protein n=1 Tax=Crenobacter oryzisoli TaxID=3056844 RepID=A0ABT7XU80_9NEIS|nr:type II secretion system F family protein [Crenobacter sp. SG2303]MDN0077109.1 type II secretion system F family protein [Crenobacter sp. SG2303]
MSKLALLAISAALLLVALGILLWKHASERAAADLAQRFVDSRLEPVATQAKTVGRAPEKMVARAAENWLEIQLNRAGIERRQIFMRTAGAALGVFALSGLLLGGFVGLGIGVLISGALGAFALWLRIAKRHRQLVRQLPNYLDAIVRLITIGNSVQSAFQSAIANTEPPLRSCLEQVNRLLRSGLEIDKALAQTAQAYGVGELTLLASVMRLSVKYGGRADTVLERMAGFMRDREQAERELVALSAEVRLSAWVLGLLPMLMAFFILATNPHYFATLLNDGSGIKLLVGAFGLQVLGSFLLFRLARL